MWHPLHRLLCFFGIRNEFDYAPPAFGLELPHRYDPIKTFRPGPDNNRATDQPVAECCARCGAGKLHEVHRPPFFCDRLRAPSKLLGPHPFLADTDGYCIDCGGGQDVISHQRLPAGDEKWGYPNSLGGLQSSDLPPQRVGPVPADAMAAFDRDKGC